MNLTDWLKYLESLPSGLTNKSLDTVKNIAEKLDVLNFSGKIITVTGSNGKGSAVIFLESILLAAGLKTAAYISPHVLNYNERIRINGKDIASDMLCQAFSLVGKACTEVTLSYFEFSTLTALVIFKKIDPEVLILEVGLGGRFDAVNILDSNLAVITTVALEHTHILGNTEEAIGTEKSGVMRRLCPVVCGENMPKSVYQEARNLEAKLYCLNKDFSYLVNGNHWHWRCGEMIIKNLPKLKLPIKSAAIALMVVKILFSDFMITKAAIVTGLKNAFMIGRFESRTIAGKKVIFDVAHNPEASSLLSLKLMEKKIICGGRILAVVSMLKDKDIASSFAPLVKVVDKWYIGVLNDVRAASESQLIQALKLCGVIDFVFFSTVGLSFAQAIAECREKDRIVVFGSFHTIAEILK